MEERKKTAGKKVFLIYATIMKPKLGKNKKNPLYTDLRIYFTI